MTRRFRVIVKETVTFAQEFTEAELAELTGIDTTQLAGDIEDEWLTAVEADDHMTRLEETVRWPRNADVSLAEYHIEEV